MSAFYDPRPERWPQVSPKKAIIIMIAAVVYVFDPELGLTDLIVWVGDRRKPRDEQP